MLSVEYKKNMFDGVEYNLLTDEELDDLKVVSQNQYILDRINNGQSKGIEAWEFRNIIKDKYGI